MSHSLVRLHLRADRRCADFAVGDAARAHDAVVDGAGDAVALLHVDLWEENGAGVVHDARLGDVAHGRALDHVAHDEALDGLVFRAEAPAVDAVDGLGVAASHLASAVVSSLGWHFGGKSDYERYTVEKP